MEGQCTILVFVPYAYLPPGLDAHILLKSVDILDLCEPSMIHTFFIYALSLKHSETITKKVLIKCCISFMEQ